jgi:antitoxin PrlF
MSVSTITSKAQTTVPSDVRAFLQVREGSKIEWFINPVTGKVEIRAISSDFQRLAGMLHRQNELPMTRREMDEAISETVSDDDESSKL